MKTFPIRASSMARTLQCPVSAVLNENTPGKSSVYAAEGSAAHLVAASKLMTVDGTSALGHLIVHEGFEIPVNQEMDEATDAYAAYVKAIPGWLRIEQQVSLEFLAPGVGGTADAIILDPVSKRLSVVDLKYGRGVAVPVKENPQFLVYGLAALGPDNWADVETLSLHVYQPRIGNVESWDVAVADLQPYRDMMVQGINAVRAALTDPWLHTRAGDECKFCPQAATCPTLHKHATQIAAQSFTPIAQLPTVNLGLLLLQADVIDTWIGAVRQEALDRALAGETVDGYKLVAKRATRQWAVDVERVASAVKARGIDPYAEPALLSPAQLEKRVGKVEFRAYAPLVEAISGGLTLVPESDKRIGTSHLGHEADKAIAVFSKAGGFNGFD